MSGRGHNAIKMATSSRYFFIAVGASDCCSRHRGGPKSAASMAKCLDRAGATMLPLTNGPMPSGNFYFSKNSSYDGMAHAPDSPFTPGRRYDGWWVEVGSPLFSPHPGPSKTCQHGHHQLRVRQKVQGWVWWRGWSDASISEGGCLGSFYRTTAAAIPPCIGCYRSLSPRWRACGRCPCRRHTTWFGLRLRLRPRLRRLPSLARTCNAAVSDAGQSGAVLSAPRRCLRARTSLHRGPSRRLVHL